MALGDRCIGTQAGSEAGTTPEHDQRPRQVGTGSCAQPLEVERAVTTQAAIEGTPIRPVGNKLSIMMFSGTADKFIPLGVLAQAGAAMGMEVHVFVTGFALQAFTKEPHELPFPAEFTGMAPAVAHGMEAAHVESWDTMLRQAKQLGAKVHACSLMSSVMGLGAGDFGDLVDDIVGAATFVQDAEGGETFFI